jgi:WD40 repeat protein
MDKPPDLGFQLLMLAGEAVADAIGGCAATLRPDQAREVHLADGGGVREAINRFGPLIVARWAKWFCGRERREQDLAIQQLAALDFRTAYELARKAVEQAPGPVGSEEDRRLVIDYLAAIPVTARSILIPDPEGGRAGTAPPTLHDEHILLRLLPINVPPFPAGSDLPGTPYRLEQLLGSGGFGAVYKATNRFEQNTPPRAIKFCLNPDMLASLHRERELLDRLMAVGSEAQWSDRIVKLYGHNLDAPIPFLVYEFVPGGSLINRLAALRRQTGQNLRPTQVLGLVRRLGEAIAFAHTRGLVHRDIKPSNILISGNTIKLADFGIGGVVATVAAASRIGSGSLADLTASEFCSLFRGAGTPLYMSPEQRKGEPPDPRHDIYSIGVLWYQLLIGDVTRELHTGWADELAEEFDVPQKQIDIIQQCVGYVKKRPANGKELLAMLPPPALPQLPPTRSVPVGEVRALEGHEGRVNGVAFSRDSRRLLSGANDGTARLWDVEAGHPLARYPLHARSVLGVAVSPDGRWVLLAGDDRNAWLCDLARASEPRCFAGHLGPVNCVAFSPDGRRALTGSGDGSVRLWHVASGREILRIEEDRRAVTSACFTPDGLFVVACTEGGALRVWDAETGWEARELTTQGGWLLCVAVAPDGRTVACGGKGGVALWSLEDGRPIGDLEGHGLAVMSLAFSPGGQWLLTGSLDKSVRLWDVSGRRQVHTFSHRTHAVRGVAFSPDGRYAASAGDDHMVRLWGLPW